MISKKAARCEEKKNNLLHLFLMLSFLEDLKSFESKLKFRYASNSKPRRLD